MKPGFGNIEAIFRGSWISYWKTQSEVLFFGEISNIVDGKLYNEKLGSTDYLTVGGSAGSYTFQCPNNAPYITSDTDLVWFKSDGSQRTATTGNLIGYDFVRTIVKYGNVAPYEITAIMILSSNCPTLKENRMRDDFDLSIWWSNFLSFHGNIKGNRAVGKSVWPGELVFIAEYLSWKAAMPTQPSDADQYTQHTMVKSLVDGGYFAKAVKLDVYAVHSADSANINLKNPGVNNSIPQGSPVWTQYAGYLGTTGKFIDMNYNPTTDGSGILNKDNICVLLGNQVNDAVVQNAFGSAVTGYIGALNISPGNSSTRPYFLVCAASGSSPVSVGTKAHWGITRGANNKFTWIKNQTSTEVTNASDGLVNNNFYSCGARFNTGNQMSQALLSYCFVFQYLTAVEAKAVIAIMENYLDNYSTGLY